MDQTRTGVIYKQLYINVLGLLGAKLRLLILFKKSTGIKHIRVRMNNNTAVAYIKMFEGLSQICVMILFSRYGNGLQDGTFGFQQHKSQDLKM